MQQMVGQMERMADRMGRLGERVAVAEHATEKLEDIQDQQHKMKHALANIEQKLNGLDYLVQRRGREH